MLADDYGYYADDSYNEPTSGSGDALNSILAAVGAGAQVYAATSSQGRTGYPGPAPSPSPIYSSYSAQSSGSGTSMLWIIVLAVLAFFAYKNL